MGVQVPPSALIDRIKIVYYIRYMKTLNMVVEEHKDCIVNNLKKMLDNQEKFQNMSEKEKQEFIRKNACTIDSIG